MRTYAPKASEIERKWFIVDAENLVLGRMSTEVARILRGKHKPTFAPYLDCGDHVIIANAKILCILLLLSPTSPLVPDLFHPRPELCCT